MISSLDAMVLLSLLPFLCCSNLEMALDFCLRVPGTYSLAYPFSLFPPPFLKALARKKRQITGIPQS
jgi:hypothetical protein